MLENGLHCFQFAPVGGDSHVGGAHEGAAHGSQTAIVTPLAWMNSTAPGAQLGDIWVLGDLYSLQQQLGGATIDLAPRAASMERGD